MTINMMQSNFIQVLFGWKLDKNWMCSPWHTRLSACSNICKEDHQCQVRLVEVHGWMGSLWTFFAVINIAQMVSGLEKCASVLTHANTSSHCMPTLIITYIRLNIDHQLHGNVDPHLHGKIEHRSSPSWQYWSSPLWQDWTLIINMATSITCMATLNI